MPSWGWWFIAAFAVLAAELVTGTFYMLVLAVALGAGGLAALAGLGLTVQIVVTAAVAFGGALVLRRTRFGRIDNAEKTNLRLDTGQGVRIDAWNDDGTARATYRGAQWDAELDPPDTARDQPLYIREIRGNRLILTARRPGSQ